MPTRRATSFARANWIRLPLQILVKFDRLLVRLGKALDSARGGLLKFARPAAPAVSGALRTDMRNDRVEQREATECLPTPPLECAKRHRTGALGIAQARFAERAVKQLEHRQLAGRDRLIIDLAHLTQNREPPLKLCGSHPPPCGYAVAKIVDRLDIETKHVEEEPAARRIGAGMSRSIWEKRMKGIEADRGGAKPRRTSDECVEVGEIADAPVAFGSEAVKAAPQRPNGAVFR